jgi:hypothetical protein
MDLGFSDFPRPRAFAQADLNPGPLRPGPASKARTSGPAFDIYPVSVGGRRGPGHLSSDGIQMAQSR